MLIIKEHNMIYMAGFRCIIFGKSFSSNRWVGGVSQLSFRIMGPVEVGNPLLNLVLRDLVQLCDPPL